MAKIDDVSWHIDTALSENKNPTDAEYEEAIKRAGAHIGLLVRWCLARGQLGEDYSGDEDAQTDAEAVRQGRMTGSAFCERYFDWKPDTEDFDPNLRPFLDSYVRAENCLFFHDVSMDAEPYTWTESETIYQYFERMMDHRKTEFELLGPKAVQFKQEGVSFISKLFGSPDPKPMSWRH